MTEEYAEQQKKVGEEQRDVREARGEVEETERGGDGKMPRFDAIKNETNLAFAQRAESRLALIAADIEVLEEQAKLASSDRREEMDKELAKAREAYDEALKDLDEVRDRTGTFVDDGRLGVAMAINRAQRKLENVREDLAGTIY
jgi:chromosome segregation ATPase